MSEDFPRVGVLVPSSNVGTERDYRELFPQDVSVHAARMFMEDASSEAATALVAEHVWQAAEQLRTAEPHVVVFSCTGAGAIIGEEAEQRLIEQLSEVMSTPVVSTNRAVREEIASHGPATVALLTPYVDDITDHVAKARESEGYEVTHAAGMGITRNLDIAKVSEAELLDFAARHLRGARFDLLFLSCTNLRTARVVDPLARRYGVPVVTSNVASAKAALAALDREPVTGRADPSH